MGVIHRVMSFFGLVGEEEVRTEKLSKREIEYEEDDWLADESDYYANSSYVPTKKAAASQNKVISLQAIKQHVKLVLVEPRSYEDTQELADYLRERRIVLTNLQRMNHEQAKRIVDFLSGTVYALGGDIQKVGPNIFLCTPDTVEIQGSISEVFEENVQSRMR